MRERFWAIKEKGEESVETKKTWREIKEKRTEEMRRKG